MFFERLQQKITHDDYLRLIHTHQQTFSQAEQDLLNEILERFDFDVVQAQALAQAVLQQARLTPMPCILKMMMKTSRVYVRIVLTHPCRLYAIIWFGAKHAVNTAVGNMSRPIVFRLIPLQYCQSSGYDLNGQPPQSQYVYHLRVPLVN